MTKSQVLKKTREYVKGVLADEATGHDWYHIERVVRNAKLIGKKEKADLFVVELAALLHDIADWKFHADPDAGVKLTVKKLKSLKVPKSIIDQVAYIVQYISFKVGKNTHRMTTIEGKVVQDADRLDALGAIGIARAFAYGGYKKRMIYDPKKENETTIGHFYEKILWLTDLMNTKTGYNLALKREKFVKDFLKQFYKEWDGKN
ncbi:MAG: HD domain-containing protein [Candidatus Doudnabacteria bacterium]|nr:HD domain-containing protein [Candidatus Doudnabacteria bacterium]